MKIYDPTAPFNETLTLKTGDRFSITCAFTNVPQVEAAFVDLADVLTQVGLVRAERGGLVWSLVQDAEIPAAGYVIAVEPGARRIEIRAADGEGGRCGVYAALEMLGVRWFSPSQPPVLPTLPLEQSAARVTSAPASSYRGLHICAGAHHYDEAVASWMRRNKMNRKLTHPSEVDPLRSELARAGLQPDTTVHSYSDWISDTDYYPVHPEWFALVGGKRIRHRDGGQLCLANTEMRGAFVQHIGSYLDAHPEVAVIGICPQDGYGWCECDLCRALDTPADRQSDTVNGRVAHFVDDICARLEKTHPTVQVGHYSYSNFADFPLLREKLPDNLLLSFTLSRCFRHAIDDPDCPGNRPLYERLSTLAGKVDHSYVYEYYVHRWASLPAPFWRVVARDMAAYRELGLSGFMSEVSGADHVSWQSFHLPLYVAARCLFDANADVDAILRDYCERRFGAAAEPMYAYLTALEKGWLSASGCGVHNPAEFVGFFTSDLRAQCRTYLDEARSLAPKGTYCDAVAGEVGLFGEWERIADTQGRYQIESPVKPLPMSELTLTARPDPARAIHFTDHSTLIPPAQGRSRGWVYADNATLGFLIECDEEAMKNLVIKEGNTLGAVYGSDGLEIFLAATPSAPICYHLLINAAGAHVASECEGKRWNWSWAGDYTVEAKQMKDRWRIVLRMPKATLGVSADGGFGFTLVRNRHVGGKWVITGLPQGGAFFDTKRYLQVNPFEN